MKKLFIPALFLVSFLHVSAQSNAPFCIDRNNPSNPNGRDCEDETLSCTHITAGIDLPGSNNWRCLPPDSSQGMRGSGRVRNGGQNNGQGFTMPLYARVMAPAFVPPLIRTAPAAYPAYQPLRNIPPTAAATNNAPASRAQSRGRGMCVTGCGQEIGECMKINCVPANYSGDTWLAKWFAYVADLPRCIAACTNAAYANNCDPAIVSCLPGR